MKKLALLLFVALLLAACQPAATPQATAIQPPTPTPISVPVEALANSTSDLVGVWKFNNSPLRIEFKADGTYGLYFGYGTETETADGGNYSFTSGKVTWVTSSGCSDQAATYEAYVTKQDGKPVSLRLQVVGSDPCAERANTNSIALFQENPPASAPVEALAGSTSDVIGTWWFTQASVMIEFKLDGRYRVYVGSETQDEGTYTLDAGKVSWVSTNGSCVDKPATYEAYVTKEDGTPTWLRLQVVGSDGCSDRVWTVTGKAKFQSP